MGSVLLPKILLIALSFGTVLNIEVWSGSVAAGLYPSLSFRQFENAKKNMLCVGSPPVPSSLIGPPLWPLDVAIGEDAVLSTSAASVRPRQAETWRLKCKCHDIAYMPICTTEFRTRHPRFSPRLNLSLTSDLHDWNLERSQAQSLFDRVSHIRCDELVDLRCGLNIVNPEEPISVQLVCLAVPTFIPLLIRI